MSPIDRRNTLLTPYTFNFSSTTSSFAKSWVWCFPSSTQSLPKFDEITRLTLHTVTWRLRIGFKTAHQRYGGNLNGIISGRLFSIQITSTFWHSPPTIPVRLLTCL